MKSPGATSANCSLEKWILVRVPRPKCPWKGSTERVRFPYLAVMSRVLLQTAFDESGCLGMQPKMGGKLHLKLNMGTRPIANKYREGKMKSTLKRESKARETVTREMIEASSARVTISACGLKLWVCMS